MQLALSSQNSIYLFNQAKTLTRNVNKNRSLQILPFLAVLPENLQERLSNTLNVGLARPT